MYFFLFMLHVHLRLVECSAPYCLHSETQTDRASHEHLGPFDKREEYYKLHARSWSFSVEATHYPYSCFNRQSSCIVMTNSQGQRRAVLPCVQRRRTSINGNHSNNCHQIFGSFLFQSASCLKVTNVKASFFWPKRGVTPSHYLLSSSPHLRATITLQVVAALLVSIPKEGWGVIESLSNQ